VAPTPALAVAKPSLAQHRRSAAGDLRREAGPASLVRVGADRTLATVNGVAITLGHLAPLSRGDAASRSMTEAQYAHRLERAIAMELVNQAARDASIGLTAEQEQRLVELRARSAAVLEAARKEGLAWTSVTPEQIEFEVSEARTLMLQQNLIAKAGGPSVVQQAAYAVAVRDLLERLKSAGAIRRWSPGS
jgi:tRNA threonylcarbamoyladenosine modification (KEOPS) complex  Pcc1 subunit